MSMLEILGDICYHNPIVYSRFYMICFYFKISTAFSSQIGCP